MFVMELWKSSYWQQGTCYIYSWQFWSCFNSCRDYDFYHRYLLKQDGSDLAFTQFVCGTSDRFFCVAVKRLNGPEICSISVHQHSVGAWNIVCNHPLAVFNKHECYSWLIWVTFDLDHEVWPVAHEPYFNLADIGDQRDFCYVYMITSSPLNILGYIACNFV